MTTKGSVICPTCWDEQIRSEMVMELMKVPKEIPGDRYAYSVGRTPDVPRKIKWSCPKCDREDFD